MTIRVQANCAMSLDGCVGLPGPRRLRISGPEDKRRVHELRAASDAILVGVGTVLSDDPKLTVKWDLLGRKAGKDPVRIILDPNLRTPPAGELAKGPSPILLFHKAGARGGPANAERVAVPVDGQGRLSLPDVLAELDRRGVHSLMVEGGPTVLTSFLEEKLVDALSVYVAPLLVGLPEAPRLFTGRGPKELGLRFQHAKPLDDGVVLHFAR